VVQADFEEGLRRIEDALEHLKSLFAADSNFSQRKCLAWVPPCPPPCRCSC
jgi:hypothetical protein